MIFLCCHPAGSAAPRKLDPGPHQRPATLLGMRAGRAYLPGMPVTKPMTADDLLHLYLPDQRTELIRGRLVVREPAGARHGGVANELAFLLTGHVKEHRLGRVYAAETGFHIEQDPDTVRAPDVAFVSNERSLGPDPLDFPRFAPDLAVEVLSPGDRRGELREKVGAWLSAARGSCG